MLVMDCVDFSSVSLYVTMNHNRFSQEIEKILSRCEYMFLTTIRWMGIEYNNMINFKSSGFKLNKMKSKFPLILWANDT